MVEVQKKTKQKFGGEVIVREYHGGAIQPDMVLQKDIVIPKGTVFTRAPKETKRHGMNHYCAGIGLSDDTSGDLNYYIDPDDDELSQWFRAKGE